MMKVTNAASTADPIILEGLSAALAVEAGTEIDGGRFADWSTSMIAAECRAQSRDQLDPEFSRFMGEVAKRLSALTTSPASSGVEGEAVARIVSAHGDPEAFGEREIRVLLDLQKYRYNTDLFANPAKKEWQPIETYHAADKFVKVSHVLCAHADKRWIRMGRYYPEMKHWYYSGTNERSQWAQVEGDEPTHWQPLPAAPSPHQEGR